jgi:hypothetical protein
MVANTSGTLNVAVGGGLYGSTAGALGANTTGSYNTAVGHSALRANTTASNNTAVGYQSLYANTTGTNNTAIGNYTGLALTTGTINSFLGRSAGESATTGSKNTFVGNNAGQAVTTGSNNTIIGRYNGNQGGLDIRTSSNNIVLSDGDGNPRIVVRSSGDVGIGSVSPDAKLRIDGSSTGDTIGTFSVRNQNSASAACVASFVTATNSTATSNVLIRFGINNYASGSGMITANGASAAAFGAFSDRRLKENIVDLPPQLDNILALRPVEFDYIESEGGGHQISFIAQEIEEIYPDVVGEREDGMKTLTGWDKTTARLVKAIQEQQATITALEARIAALEAN